MILFTSITTVSRFLMDSSLTGLLGARPFSLALLVGKIPIVGVYKACGVLHLLTRRSFVVVVKENQARRRRVHQDLVS